MLHPVRYPRHTDRNQGGDDIHRDGQHLRPLGRIAHLADDGRDEETARVARADDADVHEGAAPDFPVAEDAARGAAVEAVHLGLAAVGAEAGEEVCAFVGGEECGGLGPGGDEEEAENADQDGDYAFENEAFLLV